MEGDTVVQHLALCPLHLLQVVLLSSCCPHIAPLQQILVLSAQ